MSKHSAGEEEKRSTNGLNTNNVIKNGDMSIVQQFATNNTPVLIRCDDNKMLQCNVRTYDEYSNMLVLENVKETWFEIPRDEHGGRKGKAIITKVRYLKKKCLRGNSVVLIVASQNHQFSF